jgi:hypothetical protein
MYQVNLQPRPFQIEWLSSADGRNWNTNIINSIHSDLNDTLVPWHLDMIAAEGKYYMLLSCRTHLFDPDHQQLMLGESSDLINWHFHPKPILFTDPSFHDCRSMYRSSGIISDHKLALWYSMLRLDGTWRIGFEKFDMDSI